MRICSSEVVSRLKPATLAVELPVLRLVLCDGCSQRISPHNLLCDGESRLKFGLGSDDFQVALTFLELLKPVVVLGLAIEQREPQAVANACQKAENVQTSQPAPLTSRCC